MTRYVNGNSISGLFLLILGSVTAFYSIWMYDIGTLDRMGPGMYPAALGALLAILGAIITASAIAQEVEPSKVNYRALLLIIVGIVLFGMLIEFIGLVPSTLVLIFLSNLAGGRIRPVQSVILAGLVSLAVVLIFDYGLHIPLRPFRWPL